MVYMTRYWISTLHKTYSRDYNGLSFPHQFPDLEVKSETAVNRRKSLNARIIERKSVFCTGQRQRITNNKEINDLAVKKIYLAEAEVDQPAETKVVTFLWSGAGLLGSDEFAGKLSPFK